MQEGCAMSFAIPDWPVSARLTGRDGTRSRADRQVSVRHRNDLQGLRAVAVLLVALSHAGVGFVAGGFVGVDVFFVLSGFLITGLLIADASKHGSVSLVDFYSRRAKRILPAATLTLLVTDIAAFRLLNPIRAKEVVSDSARRCSSLQISTSPTRERTTLRGRSRRRPCSTTGRSRSRSSSTSSGLRPSPLSSSGSG